MHHLGRTRDFYFGFFPFFPMGFAVLPRLASNSWPSYFASLLLEFQARTTAITSPTLVFSFLLKHFHPHMAGAF